MVCLFTFFFPVISFPKYKNVKKNVNGAKDDYHYWANYINTGCDNIRVFDLNWWWRWWWLWWGFFFCFFFFTPLFSKENRTKNPAQDIFYMVNARYILWILLLVVFFAFYQVTSSNLRWTECKIEYVLMMISHHLLVWITFPTLQTFD